MVDPRPVQIILRPGDTIALQVRNSSGARKDPPHPRQSV
jgi:hypothetical protein